MNGVFTTAVPILLLALSRMTSGQVPEPFHFFVAAPSIDSAGREVWAAFVRPGDRTGDSARAGPAAFRIRLDQPATEASRGKMIKGTLLRGDPGGSEFFNVAFGEKFIPAPKAGMAALSVERADSLTFTATVQDAGAAAGLWLARVKLPNGGQFVLALDRANRWGEFRPIPQYNLQVFLAIEGLFAPR